MQVYCHITGDNKLNDEINIILTGNIKNSPLWVTGENELIES